MKISNLKEVSKKEGGILAQLWREIVIDNNLSGALKYLLDMYERKGGTRNKNTINAAFTSPDLTWKNFTFLILKILPVKKMKFYVDVVMYDYDIKKKKLASYTSKHCIEITQEDVDEKVSGQKLAKLRDEIIDSNNLRSALKVLIDDYEERGGAKNKSSLQMQISADDITWKTFIFVIMEILLTKELRICVEIELLSGVKSSHCLTVMGNKVLDNKPEDEQKKLLTTINMLKTMEVEKGDKDEQSKTNNSK